MSAKQERFTTFKNSIDSDEEIRAAMFPKSYKHLIKSEILGMNKWSLLARLAKQTFLTAVRSVEKINILDSNMDSMGRMGAINPNIQPETAMEWDEELDDELEVDSRS